jgi:hypothetical protein
MSAHARPSAHIWTLRLLLTIFVVRVVAQPLALWLGAAYLPPFDAWHSGALPYAGLLISQLAIVAGAYFLIRGLSSGAARPRRGVGQVVLAAGSVYGVVMLARLLLGATVLSGHPWFARPLPTLFHLDLAAFVLVYGHFHYRYGTQ